MGSMGLGAILTSELEEGEERKEGASRQILIQHDGPDPSAAPTQTPITVLVLL